MIAFQMPALLAVSSFFYGAAFGLLKIVWIVIAAVFLYDISVETGQFEIMKQSVAAITPDRRLQLLLVAFCFGAFIEGCAGFGAPVAIAGAFMIGLGFKPFQAAALNLIANTSPVAWGAIGTPVHTLAAVTALNESDLNAMIGRILPITAVVVPIWLVRSMVSWKETLQVFPAILVVGGSFAATQWFWANHMDSNLVDISAGVVSLVATMLFLRVWQPKKIWRFPDEAAELLDVEVKEVAWGVAFVAQRRRFGRFQRREAVEMMAAQDAGKSSLGDGQNHHDLSVGATLAAQSKDLGFELGAGLARLGKRP